MIREQVRYKLYIAQSLPDAARDPKRMNGYANYSQPCYVDSLNKENQRRLRVLMDPATPMYTYIDDVGYKVPYRYACKDSEHPVVYVIEGCRRVIKEGDADRELINLKRVRWEEVPSWRKTNAAFWGAADIPKADAFLSYIRYESARPVYVDRFTKKELNKLAMLLILPENVYLDNVGCVRVNRRGEREFFMEVDSE